MTQDQKDAQRPATRDDVSRLAGVSSAVVSYVINNGPRPVSAAARLRVEQAIEQLNYRPNSAAKALMTGKSQLIGVVVPDLESSYFSVMASEIELAAAQRGLHVIVTQAIPQDLNNRIDSLVSHQVDGIIAFGFQRGWPEPALGLSIPVVKLNARVNSDTVATFAPDYTQGTKDAVRHLIEVHGHRNIAMITGPDMDGFRERAWRDELVAQGLTPGPVLEAGWQYGAAFDAAVTLTRDHPDVTAFFSAADRLAVGAIAGLHSVGRSVPGDLAVVSFDDSRLAKYAVPPITSTGFSYRQMAHDVVDAVLSGDTSGHIYPTTLVIRESCGCTSTSDVGQRTVQIGGG